MTHSYAISATQYQILMEHQRQVSAAQTALNLACTIVLAQYDVIEAKPKSVEHTAEGSYVLLAELPDPQPSAEASQ